MERKLKPSEIDERNSRIRLPVKNGQIDWDSIIEIMDSTFITRKDGSEVSLANAVYADLEWLHRSQERALRRIQFGVLEPYRH